MICALTVRRLKPGTFEDFRSTFMRYANPETLPDGWVRFDMVRNTADPDEVICFGFFDGSVDDIKSAGDESEYRRQQEEIAPFVESVGADGFFEVVEEHAVA